MGQRQTRLTPRPRLCCLGLSTYRSPIRDMATFSSLPDPWDDPASPPPQPASDATSTDSTSPTPDLDTDLFRDVLVDLDGLLQNPPSSDLEPTHPPKSDTPPPVSSAPIASDAVSEVISEPTATVSEHSSSSNLADRISKFEPLELAEPGDETLPLLDMPLADLQAAFGIGSRPSQPAAPPPKSAAAPQNPSNPVPTVSSEHPLEEPTPEPTTVATPPEQPDPLQTAAIAYREAEVNETVEILNDLFELQQPSTEAQPEAQRDRKSVV